MLKKSSAFLLLLALISCGKSDEINTNPKSNQIKHFGFTLIDTYWDDPSDNSTKSNYADEVHTFSNIADILVVNPTDDIVDRMKYFNTLEMKSIIHISEIFFEINGTNNLSGSNYDLRSDYRERWESFMNTNKLEANKNLIQTLYLGEEPTWNSISFEDLKTASDLVKSSLPSIPIMVIEASKVIDSFKIPTSVDWVGFDHYFIKNPRTNSEFQNELTTLKNKLTKDQKLVLVMDTHYIEGIHDNFGGISINEMGDVANNYYQLAQEEPLTIAILGYFWPSGFDTPNSIGARNMPSEVLDTYKRIGKEITNK